jgi:hypothetical protein
MIWAIIKFQPANPKESPLGTLPAPAAAAAAAAAASSREFAPSAITESADI